MVLLRALSTLFDMTSNAIGAPTLRATEAAVAGDVNMDVGDSISTDNGGRVTDYVDLTQQQ